VRDYWIPTYRYQYIEFLRNRYPKDDRKFHRMKMGQLKAIYIRIREDILRNEKLAIET